MSVKEIKQVVEGRSKFNVSKNTKVREYGDIIFDSVLEMRYYKEYVLPKISTGEIISCCMQVPYELQPKFYYNGIVQRAIIYKADFELTYKNGKKEVIDIKGFADATAKLKRKLFYFKYPLVNYKWICYSKIDGGWCEYDYVQKARAERKKEKKANEKK